MSFLSQGFTTSPRFIVDELGWDHYILYSYLVYYASWADGFRKKRKDWRRGELIRSISIIEKDLPYSASKINRLVTELVDAGLIAKRSEGRKQGTRFTIIHYDELTKKTENKRKTNGKQTENKTPSGSSTYDTSEKTNEKQMKNKWKTNEQHIKEGTNLLNNERREIAQKIADLWNEHTAIKEPFAKVLKMTDARIKHAIARFKEIPELYNWRLMMIFIRENPQWNGENHTEKYQFIADFDWLLKPANATKVFEKVESGIDPNPKAKKKIAGGVDKTGMRYSKPNKAKVIKM